MLNYISVDLVRVLKRKSVIIWFCIQVLMMVGGAVGKIFLDKAGFGIDIDSILSVTFSAATIVIGIPVFLAVFKDDLQSKTSQNSIGMGIRRDQIVKGRFIETSILYILIFAILLALAFAIGIPFGLTMPRFLDIAKSTGDTVFHMICYTAISMIVVFGTMNTSFAQTCFLLLNLGIVESIIDAVNLIPFFVKHNINLSYLTINGLEGLAKSKTFAAAPLMWVVIIAAFIILPLIITVAIFNKKELDL